MAASGPGATRGGHQPDPPASLPALRSPGAYGAGGGQPQPAPRARQTSTRTLLSSGTRLSASLLITSTSTSQGGSSPPWGSLTIQGGYL
jgi:hypothetical protein